MLRKIMVHIKCRGGVYPFSEVTRMLIPDDLVPWSKHAPNYNPPEYNSLSLLNKSWADPPLDDPNFKPKWNEMNGKVNRKSHTGTYQIVNGTPLNPEGRTGIAGRGILGKWGPNHAADPIVTRWKMSNGTKETDLHSKLPILQFCAIQRRDCKEWALPGGMVDPGEQISETLKREFQEEAMNSLQTSKEQVEYDKKMIQEFFRGGELIYKGYVDDPRNTDNAWMETVAVNFHDEDSTHAGKFYLKAGDDAQNVKWMDINKNVKLYASHSSFIKMVVDRLNAHW